MLNWVQTERQNVSKYIQYPVFAYRQSASVLKYIQYAELLIDSASVFQSINYTVC